MYSIHDILKQWCRNLKVFSIRVVASCYCIFMNRIYSNFTSISGSLIGFGKFKNGSHFTTLINRVGFILSFRYTCYRTRKTSFKVIKSYAYGIIYILWFLVYWYISYSCACCVKFVFRVIMCHRLHSKWFIYLQHQIVYRVCIPMLHNILYWLL